LETKRKRLMSGSSNIPGREQVLLEPFYYLTDNPGKLVRSRLMDAFNVWIKVPDDKLKVIMDVVEMLHTASLLIDDIEDSSTLRRGNPVAHHIYGIPSTINCANYVYFLALQRLLELKRPDLVTIYAEELCNLHQGQGMDLYWRDKNICPTEDQYLEMIANKTGGLLRLAVKLMQAYGDASVDFVPIVNRLGIHFQVRDDYINLQSDQYMKEKGFCEDITEGKFSLPIIHCIQHDKYHRLINILKQKTQEPEVLRFAVDCIKKAGSFEYTLAYLAKIEKELRAEIDKLGGNPKLVRILDALAQIYAQKDA